MCVCVGFETVWFAVPREDVEEGEVGVELLPAVLLEGPGLPAVCRCGCGCGLGGSE